MKYLFTFSLLCLFVLQAESWNDGGSVLLREVQVLTLYRGQYTTSRRTSPVPQLQCIGGSAGCSSFVPDVVQCQNKGWDGIDVQWECKTDMDNAYRFGRIEVSCEGFNHPDDPYILKGSCGLEYTMELTEQGRQRGGGGGGGGGGFGGSAQLFQGSSDSRRSHQGSNSYHQSSTGGDMTGDISGLVVVGLFLLLAYGVYKMFLCGPVPGQHRFPGGNPQGPDAHGYPHNTEPPPPGFKPDYTNDSSGYGSSAGYPGGSAGYPGASSGFGFRNEFMGPRPAQNASSTGNGFWSGMGTGGVLGYLFGSQRRQSGMPTGSSGYSWNSGTPKTSPASSGTRTASGFGGTKRR
ncbi:hypothetical protein ANANG_G00139420 [Anguilla anguilla]|uniref:Store-operated calcium entry-associated regulatory factor n=2 Tax=Anguilla anguilla TaxID=7936 RepID=A0A9D3MC64_ANGAN|nr:hypothetical protein ANANG_G00139420 [Anguilla anguilla]